MIAIVGGGITGLALAHELERRGVEHVVLESSSRPGGVMHSARVEGRLLEWGPQRGRMTESMQALVRDLGMEDEVVLAPGGLPLFVYADGRLRKVPFSPGEFLRSDILTPAGKARLLLEPLTGAARDEERVGDLFTRKIGRQAYERLVGPLYGGLYASDPADMVVGLSLGHVLREFGVGRSLMLTLLRRGGRVDPPAACSFREGLAALPRALYTRHARRVRLETPVRTLAHTGAGWRVETDGGTLDAETVVMTAPAPVAARLLADAAPDAAARVGRLRYNPLAVVHLHAEGVPEGLGYQVSLGERLYTRGVTFNASLFGRDGVYTVYLGGAKAPEVVARPDEELARIAVDEFRVATGRPARALSVARERMPAWDASWEALRGMALPAGLHVAANWESRPGIPGRLAQAKRLAGVLAKGAGAGVGAGR